MINRILNLCTWRNFHDFQSVIFVVRILLALHDENVLEALVIFLAVQGRTIAKAVELEAFKRCNNCAWLE